MVISCSYNYSNFDDQPVVEANLSVTETRGALQDEGVAEEEGITGNSADDRDADLSSLYGELVVGDFIEEEQEEQGHEQEVDDGLASACVVSSQQEIGSRKEVAAVKEEEEEGQIAKVEGQSPGSNNAATGLNASGESSGDRLRKGKPKESSKKKASEMQQQPFKQEGGVALWVKWRGKWRACIQCYPNDFSSSTSRAMPTYSKKTYVVVFFPNSRTYSWVDLEYACHITESPEPLAFGTHQSGRDAVDNLDLPKHHMLRVLAANMLDISDRLPVKAVVESAQSVNAWKEFANEAVAAKEYSDISKMLVKLFGMVQLSFYSDAWVQESFHRWKSDCETADNAQGVENLNKELVNAILWENVSSLWDAPEQLAVGGEWKDWKRAVIENRSVYPSISLTPDKSLFMDPESLKRRRTDVDLALKRSKLEVRRRYPTQFFPIKKDEPSGMSGENQQEAGQLQSPQMFSTPPPLPKAEEDDLSGRSSSLVQQSSLTVSKRLLSNYQLCAAYMETKKRQCTRFPSQGSLYCCKHMSLATEDGIEGVRKLDFSPPKPASAPPKSSTTILPKMPGDRICEGMTKYGRRCTHRSKEGSWFCKKHTFADAPHLNPDSAAENPTPEKVEMSFDQVVKSETMVEAKQENQVPMASEEREESSHERKVSSERTTKNYTWHAKRIGKMIKSNASAAIRIRCLGRCVNGDQCSHKSRPGSDYCEKHQPENGSQEKPVTAEVKKQDDAQALLKARTWLSRYMESAKVDGAGRSDNVDPSEKLLEWVLAEASKDMTAAEALMKLVSVRTEKLGSFLKLQERAEAAAAAAVTDMEGALEEDEDNNLQDQQHKLLDKIKCSICDDEFTEMLELGNHWKSSHPTEAHWFLKGYACTECKKEFTNKSSLERHCKADHEAVADVSAFTVTVCINCDEQFVDFEALWDHVVTGHPDHLSAMPAISLPADDRMEDLKLAEDDQTIVSYPVVAEEKEKQEDRSASTRKKNTDSADEDYTGAQSSGAESYEEMNVADYLDSSSYLEDTGDTESKYKCKLCGKQFRLLPDLGRHHQAEHMSAHVGTISKARTGGLIPGGSRRSRKRIKVSSSNKQGMSSMFRIRKALHSVQRQKNERSESEHETSAKQLQGGGPTEEEVLAAANTACCETRLWAILEDKFRGVPKVLLSKLLANQVFKWTQEGYVCPENCGKPSDRDMRQHIYRKGTIPPSARKRSVVLCEDISFGKEFTAVPCVEDEEVESCTCAQCREGKSYHVDSLRPWETFRYVTRRLLDPSLGLDTKDSQIGCSCGRGKCTPKSCDHVEMFDSDYAEACDIWGEEMMGRFPYDGEGRIILQEGYLVYECNTSCMCSAECPNRVLQRGVRVKLEVFRTKHKGWAVRAAQNIPRGTFVCEYLGEVLNDQEANKRGERYDQVGCSYLYDIDVHLKTGGRSRRGPSRLPRIKPFVIDATKHGNVSRFMNHSCSPNLVNYQVLVESMDYQLAHIGLYASRDILCGEELSYDYRYKLLPGRGCPCHCGASGCRGRLY